MTKYSKSFKNIIFLGFFEILQILEILPNLNSRIGSFTNHVSKQILSNDFRRFHRVDFLDELKISIFSKEKKLRKIFRK